MTENAGNSSSTQFAMVVAAFAVIIALVIVFGGVGGDDGNGNGGEIAHQTGVQLPMSRPAALPGGANENTPAASTDSPRASIARELVPSEIRALEEMPDDVAEAFARGTAPISDEKRALMGKGMEEIPPRIREEMENAPYRPIPAHIREAFENPYPKVSDEEYEMLMQNGRNREAQ